MTTLYQWDLALSLANSLAVTIAACKASLGYNLSPITPLEGESKTKCASINLCASSFTFG